MDFRDHYYDSPPEVEPARSKIEVDLRNSLFVLTVKHRLPINSVGLATLAAEIAYDLPPATEGPAA